MIAASAAGRFRVLISPVRVVFLILWTGSLTVLTIVDGKVPLFALAVAGYAVYLGAVAAWLLPEVVPIESDPVLRAAGTGGRLVARCFVVLATIAVVVAYGNAFAGLEGGAQVPVFTPLIKTLREIHLWPGVGGFELFNLASYALIPGALLCALGARPRELGLCIPACATLIGMVLCIIPSATFVGWGLASGRLSSGGLFFLLVHNLLSNGFSEEFSCRGMVLSHLRAFLKSDWALLVQAVVFALLHFHPTGAEEQANALRSLAEDIALNMPVGLAFGDLALRSRSLVLPTCLHIFRWTPSA